jgi:hypothetical protein
VLQEQSAVHNFDPFNFKAAFRGKELYSRKEPDDLDAREADSAHFPSAPPTSRA